LTYKGELKNGASICSVISLDDDQAREMIMKELKKERSFKTIAEWKKNGFAIIGIAVDEN